MIGPSMTLVSTGNIYNAGLSYGANKAVEKETGMQTSEYIINKIEDYPTNNNIKEDQLNSLMILLELNIEKTKKKNQLVIYLNYNNMSLDHFCNAQMVNRV